MRSWSGSTRPGSPSATSPLLARVPAKSSSRIPPATPASCSSPADQVPRPFDRPTWTIGGSTQAVGNPDQFLGAESGVRVAARRDGEQLTLLAPYDLAGDGMAPVSAHGDRRPRHSGRRQPDAADVLADPDRLVV